MSVIPARPSSARVLDDIGNTLRGWYLIARLYPEDLRSENVALRWLYSHAGSVAAVIRRQ